MAVFLQTEVHSGLNHLNCQLNTSQEANPFWLNSTISNDNVVIYYSDKHNITPCNDSPTISFW